VAVEPGATSGAAVDRQRGEFRNQNRTAAIITQRSGGREDNALALPFPDCVTDKPNLMEDPNNSVDVSTQPSPGLSLSGRLMNVYAAPGEVFEAIKPTPPAASNWLVPILLACLVGVVNVWVMFSQPAVQQQLREQQTKQFEQMVDDGKMTREQVEGIQEKLGDTQFLIAKIAGSFGAVFFSVIWLFFISLLLWLFARWIFKTRFAYMKAVEMVGLSTMIGVLGGIIGLLVIVATGNMYATPGPALLIQDYDLTNKTHLMLSSLNLVTLWYVGVLSVGLSKLTGKPFLTAALWLYGIWAVLRAGIIFSGLGGSGM